MHSLTEDGHALDRGQWCDAMAQIGNVPVLTELTDHLFRQFLQLLLEIISLQLKSKQSVEFKHKTTHWTLVQILRIEIALQGDIRTDCLTSH